jgi:hypothetical protein
MSLQETLNTIDFNIISDTLLNKTLLIIENDKYQIMEIEFYLNSIQHPDPFVHKNSQQLTSGKWYFHRMGEGMKYKNGTFKGLDITFGLNCYGGILIRAIYDIKNNQMIEGPCLVVNEILNKTNLDNIEDLVDYLPGDVFNGPLKIINMAVSPANNDKNKNVDRRTDKIYGCPRVGLNPDKHNDKTYFILPYRHMTHPDLIKKDRAGIKYGLKNNHNLSDDEIKQLLSIRH